jgi:hypothetical protein
LRERGIKGVRVLVIGLKSLKSEAKIDFFKKLNRLISKKKEDTINE